MKSNETREPIVLHQVPVLPELEAKALIIKLLSGASLRTEDILLRRKEGKYQAFVMIPSGKVEEICSLKELTSGNDKIFVRKWYANYQVFVGRLPQTLSLDDVTSAISSQFGKIIKHEEVQPHEGSKNKFRHLYLQFQREEDAERCLFSSHKLIVKNFELRVARPYAVGENEQTDKKLFIKVVPSPDDNEQLEIALNNHFRKQGKLREKIRLQSGKGPIIFTTNDAADRVLKNFKSIKIDKYDVILRPYANYKDNFTAFMANINPTLNEAELQELLHEYEPIISCKLHPSSSKIFNATVTFGSEQSFKRILTEYKTNQKLRIIFAGSPYVTLHMSAKERNDYNNFRRGNDKLKGPVNPPKEFRPMMSFPNQEQAFMFPQQQFGFGFPPQMPMGIPMNPNMRVPLPAQYRK